jgi:hypothetical protein
MGSVILPSRREILMIGHEVHGDESEEQETDQNDTEISRTADNLVIKVSR